MSKRKRKATKATGVRCLIIGGMAFVLGGILAIVKPVYLATSGGMGHHGANRVTSYYGPSQSQAFGAIFLLIALFLFLVARHLAKEK